MFSSNICFLSCIQVSQEAGQVVWYSHFFYNFTQFIVIHTITGFGIVNKGEIYVFLELSCFYNDPADIGNLISGSSAFSKTSLNIWKFTVHVGLCIKTFVSPHEKSVCGSSSNNQNWHGAQTGFKSGKEHVKAVYYNLAYLTYMQSTSWEMRDWMKYKLESRLPGEILISLDMQMTPPLWQKVKQNWGVSWWKWKRRVKELA